MSISSSSSTKRSSKPRRDRKDRHQARYRILDVTRLTGLSADTLRYYEKIGLLRSINRTASGIRVYTDKDISRLNFIQRAQKMNFSLAEIASLLKMREDPQRAKKNVRELTSAKLTEVESRLSEITILRNELQLLLNLCQASEDGCPIIESIDAREKRAPNRKSSSARKARER
ncbi:MAG: heavy metal-responsive transcriptional regulator [Gammaproteobacteria bacterium]|nr:heavy metal-responsive transcriptional regulator [Gammaproteobacteria bacterium]NIR28866.1 heavy metal-responsive transcriptional regulator [Gammaproteobacteria bacterium]NIR97247.1 heavy metal-responsive transcriptional regulator [Gammaproteobacteria bacterium]NIT62958.1 heavy metal-responsive transcriptional regulator [Gammaproteobacteria bacterium]NIV20648.1 MerR family transcriptional regulator [Gammaproteobacteria bacterium]